MTVLVIGDDVRSLPVAAVASATSGEKVLFTSSIDRGELSVAVTGSGFDGTATIASVRPDAAVAADSFVVAAPAKDLEGLLSVHSERFAGKPVLLAPGGFAGALVCGELFASKGLPVPAFSEVPGWLVGGDLGEDGVRITMRKRNLEHAAPGAEATASAQAHFSAYFPDLVKSDLVLTSLSNINALIHPPIAIANATRMENGEVWHYWHEGFTPAVERVMVAIDRERLSVIEALGRRGSSLLEMALAAYSESGMRGDSYYEAVKSNQKPGSERPGPTQLDSRFLTDDVPFGVAAYEQLAEVLGLEHTALTAVRVMSELLLGRELTADQAAVMALIEFARNGSS